MGLDFLSQSQEDREADWSTRIDRYTWDAAKDPKKEFRIIGNDTGTITGIFHHKQGIWVQVEGHPDRDDIREMGTPVEDSLGEIRKGDPEAGEIRYPENWG